MGNKGLMLVLVASFFAACSEAPKKETAERTERSARVKDYTVDDWSHQEVPEWANTLNSDDLENLPQANVYKYFVGESGDEIFDRNPACTDAELDIKKRIAMEIESTFKGNASSDANQTDGAVTKTLSEAKMQEISQKIHGVDKRSTYWEKRGYAKVGQLKPVFNCKVLVRIPRKHFNELLEIAGRDLIKSKRNTASQRPAADAKTQNEDQQ